MALEITLAVKGLESRETEADPLPGTLTALLHALEGVLKVTYDTPSRRFAVGYDPHKTTLLRILRQIEVAGEQAGRVYRPTDVQASQA